MNDISSQLKESQFGEIGAGIVDPKGPLHGFCLGVGTGLFN